MHMVRSSTSDPRKSIAVQSFIKLNCTNELSESSRGDLVPILKHVTSREVNSRFTYLPSSKLNLFLNHNVNLKLGQLSCHAITHCSTLSYVS